MYAQAYVRAALAVTTITTLATVAGAGRKFL